MARHARSLSREVHDLKTAKLRRLCADRSENDVIEWLKSGDVKPFLEDWHRLFFENPERREWMQEHVDDGTWVRTMRHIVDDLVADFKNRKEQLIKRLMCCNENELKELSPETFLAHTALAIVETTNLYLNTGRQSGYTMSTTCPFIENGRYPHNMTWCFEVAFEVIDAAFHDLTRC